MSTTSARFGFTLADGSDGFSNDLHLKGNLQKIDSQAAKVIETVAASGGLQLEIVEVTINSSGTNSTYTVNGSFTRTYNNPPLVLGGTVTQTVSYIDTILDPFITSSKTGFTVKIQVAYNGTTTNNLSAGTIKMKFLVIGN